MIDNILNMPKSLDDLQTKFKKFQVELSASNIPIEQRARIIKAVGTLAGALECYPALQQPVLDIIAAGRKNLQQFDCN